jgi:hypothetical protein
MRVERMLTMMLALAPMAAAGEEAELPSLEFLDFLGGLIEVDGELVGPVDMVEVLDAPPVPEDVSVEQDWGVWETAAPADDALEEGR